MLFASYLFLCVICLSVTLSAFVGVTFDNGDNSHYKSNLRRWSLISWLFSWVSICCMMFGSYGYYIITKYDKKSMRSIDVAALIGKARVYGQHVRESIKHNIGTDKNTRKGNDAEISMAVVLGEK